MIPTNNSNNILIDFNMLVCIDIGVYNIMKKHFSESEILHKDIMKLVTVDDLLARMKYEKYNNILDFIVIDEYKGQTNKLYTDILDEYYDEILLNSVHTDILTLIKAYLMTNSVHITILYKNDSELQIINKLNINVKTIKYKERLDIKEYDSIYIRDYMDVTMFSHIIGKNIFVSNHRNNVNDNNIPNEELSSILGKTNVIYLIDIFNSIKKPVG